MITKSAFIGFLFRFFHRPLVLLPSAFLLVTSSGRLSFALYAGCNVIFVFAMSFLISWLLKRKVNLDGKIVSIFPEKGQKLIYVFICNFSGALFYFASFMIDPIMAEEMALVSILVPILAFGENVCTAYEGSVFLSLKNCVLDGLYLSLLNAVVALIREPLGYGALSIPAGKGGVFFLFNIEGDAPLWFDMISFAAGAFLIAGFVLAGFRMIDRRKNNR